MLLATALLIIGLLLVVYSADRLVFAASILCRLSGVPPVVIGMTVVSVGTSLPEIIVSVSASLHGQVDLAVGTAIGSNIVNILLILGLAALLHPFRVHSDVLRRELPLMLLVSLLAGCVFYDGVLSYSDGIFLLALAVIWLLYSVKIARLAEKQGQDSLTREQVAELPREGTLPVALLWLGVALIIMPMATRMVVDNATVLANYFAISELTIGLTVIAIGTSLLLKKNEGMAALKLYQSMLSRDATFAPEQPGQLLLLARAARQQRNYTLALSLIRGFDKRFPRHADIPAVYLFAARVLSENLKEDTMAQQILAVLLQRYPEHPASDEARQLQRTLERFAAQKPA